MVGLPDKVTPASGPVSVWEVESNQSSDFFLSLLQRHSVSHETGKLIKCHFINIWLYLA